MPKTFYHSADGPPTVIPDPRSLEEQKAAMKNVARERATARILKVWPMWKQSSASLGVYGPEVAAECVAFISEQIAATDLIDAMIDAAPDADALDLIEM